ncbi:MAG: hypothetical protein HQ504_06640 [Rhodospirillaceae bacterium]|nr:hypothetical protein [Rhodospirillaceae bacterium]
MSEDDLKDHQHFSKHVEQAIRVANREVINPVVDPLTEDKVISVAVEVAKRRAAYIEATLKMCNPGGPQPSGDELRALRMEYEEAREAFGALMTTIERGYVDLPERSK